MMFFLCAARFYKKNKTSIKQQVKNKTRGRMKWFRDAAQVAFCCLLNKSQTKYNSELKNLFIYGPILVCPCDSSSIRRIRKVMEEEKKKKHVWGFRNKNSI